MAIFYTGSYTQQGAPAVNPTGEGIGCFHINSVTGAVKLLHYTKQRSPSYLVISEDKRFLYAVEEMYEALNPKVYAYKIDKEGTLTLLNSQKIAGDYACHLAIIQDRLVVACYVSGNAMSYPILEDGRLAPCNQLIKHEGSGPNKARQEAAHTHMIHPFKNHHMYLVDLGLDKAKAYKCCTKIKKWKHVSKLDISVNPGSGARHMVLDSAHNYAYVLGELTGEVFVFKKGVSGFKLIQKINAVPENHTGDMGGAAIRLHPRGRFLYISIRELDVLVIFRVDEREKILSLVAHQSTEGKTPRDFNIDPTGNWLIAANQDSNTLVVFKINLNDGTLNVNSTVNVETPVNICWL